MYSYNKLIDLIYYPIRFKNLLNLKKEKDKSGSVQIFDKDSFENENLKIDYKEYYFSNVIARSSKTMLDCNNSKIEVKRTGTEG